MGMGIVGAPATVPTLDAAEGVAPEKQCLRGLIVRYWQAAYDGQRDVTGRAGLMVSRTAPVHEGRTGMLHPPAPGRHIQHRGVMGRPDQGNKAQTPVGYSHGTGVSTGGPATAVLGVVARDTPGVHGVVWGLQRCGAPWECYTGLRGQPAGPGSGDGAEMCAWKDMTVGSSGGQYCGRRGDDVAAWEERSRGARGVPGGGVLESWE